MARPEQKMELKYLDKKFKGIFNKYPDERAPLRDLQDDLEEEGLLEYIPQKRMHELLNTADRDSDRMITYKEFVTMVTEDLTPEERKPFHRSVVKASIAGLLPLSKQEYFMDYYTCSPPPLFIPIITAVEIIIFIYYVADQKRNHDVVVTATTGAAMYSPLVYKASRRYEAWRFVTYTFMHIGYNHIAGNMIIQVVYGVPLEMVHKWWRVALVYMLGSLLGSLTHSVIDGEIILLGASGGVYAIFGAHCASVIINWREMRCWYLVGNLLIVLVVVVPAVSLAIYTRVTAAEGEAVGALVPHGAGFIGGLFLGVAVLKNVHELPWERRLSICTLVGFVSIFVFCCVFNAAFDGYPELDWCGWEDDVTYTYKGHPCGYYV